MSNFPGLSTRRIEAFSDGVFAIVITLLAFQIKLPAIAPAEAGGQLSKILISLWPEFYTYFLSFLMVGIYWIGHHNAYHHIPFSNRVLLWLNLVSLMLVALLPFFTSLMAKHMDQQIAVVLYGVNIIAIGIANFYQWRYACSAHLVDSQVEDWFMAKVNFRLLVAPGIALVSIALSFLNTYLSAFIYTAMIVFYMFPTAIDRYRKTKPG